MLFVVVERFPKANPNVEQSQAAAQSTEEAGRDQCTKPRKRKQKIIIGPLRGPRKNHKQHAGDRADQHEKKDGGAVHPELQATLRGTNDLRLRVEYSNNGFVRPRLRSARYVGAGFDGQFGIGHWTPRCNGPRARRRYRHDPPRAGQKQ